MFSGRMLDKSTEPTITEIHAHIGDSAKENLMWLENNLAANYALKKELRFPFGNNYGWGYKYCHKNKHLCYLFFEDNSLTVMLQLGDGLKVEAYKERMSPYAMELWENRYPCGKKEGGWIHYKITDQNQLEEILLLLRIKCPLPKPKV